MTEQQIQEMMKYELLMEIIDEEASKYEITVDYYIQEFALWTLHQKNWSILIVC